MKRLLKRSLDRIRYEFENVLIVADDTLDYVIIKIEIAFHSVMDFLQDPMVQMLIVYGILFCLALSV